MTRLHHLSGMIFMILLSTIVNMTIVSMIPAGRACADERPEIFIQTGHPNGAESVAFSPDGRYVLSGSGDNTLKLWDVSTGREIRTFVGHKRSVTSVDVSSDGKYALSGSLDYTVRLWDVTTGKEIKAFQGNSSVKSIAFSPDGRFVVSGHDDKTVRLWQVSLGRAIRTFVGHTGGVRSVAFSPDGKYVLSGGEDGTRLWQVSLGSEVRSFSGNLAVNSVAFSHDGRYVLSGAPNALKLWETSTGREVQIFEKPGQVSCVAFSPDGRYVLSGDWGDIRLWDVSTGKEVRKLMKYGMVVSSASFSPDGRCVIAAGHGGIRLLEVATGSEVMSLKGYSTKIKALAFSPDNRFALSGSEDHNIRLWDLSVGREAQIFKGHSGIVSSLVFSPDNRQALSGSWDRSVRLWDVTTGKEIKTFNGHSDCVESVAFSPDGRYALSGSRDKTMKLWDVATGREARIFAGHTSTVSSVAFSPDGQYALSGSWDGTIKFWQSSTGKEVQTMKGRFPLAISPDGRYAMSGGDYGVTIREVATGKQLRILKEYDPVYFSPDGRYALSVTEGTSFKLWEVATSKEIRAFKGHTTKAASMIINSDGRYVLSGSENGEIKIWDTATGSEKITMIGFNDGEWITITPEGYFNASANGAKHLNVRIGNKIYGIDQFYAKFYRPELVQLALVGKKAPQSETLGDVLVKKPAPTVQIVFPLSGTSVEKDSIAVSLKITDNGGGIGNVNVYLNGAQVANETRGVTLKGKDSASEKMFTFTMPLIEGRNEIKAVALNREGSMESIPAMVRIVSKAAPQKPSLHALVIGINEYKNRSIALNYAVSDAAAFAGTLKKIASPLFEKTDIRLLTTPDETTKDAIIKAFDSSRSKIKPNDLFVFYDASHGVVDVVGGEEQYFLLTSNVLLLSSRHIGNDAMSQKELAGLIGSIPSQKKLVILDTCNAGKGGKEIQVALLQQTRGLTESTAVKLLQRAIGSAVFSASSDTQQALEGYKGHGLFTYVLIDGLQGKADIKKDGYITVLGLADYVEEQVVKLSGEVFNRQQTPTIQTGANFPIGMIR